MKTRIISAAVLVAILLIFLYVGNIYLNIGISVICFIGLYEFQKVVEAYKLKPFRVTNYITAAIYLSLLIILPKDKYSIVLQATVVLYTLVLLTIFLFKDDTKPADIGINLMTIVYVVFTLSHMIFLNGSIYIWLIFITAWSTDTCAYFIGVFFGKRKLCPKLSPKKTIGGSIAGILGCIISSMIFGYIFKTGNILQLGLLGLFCSIFAQVGDICASKFKRVAGIKDYGNLMPGHGGILDRFDSIIFTAPIVYYFTLFII
ncbi:phosphatidate cytidylyltransferase [Abyssisolibacter fermentans]|uniref:phosphatidate cytidylyltransferase n=1 Tax=Abyssisolibacter fermentans TaxID=1766203 RepID=UPI00083066A7|nr:phosphatidate cytidylyltransferase [Abyssisolibacter fermentans]